MSFGHKYARGFAGIDDHLAASDHDPVVHERVGHSHQSHRHSMGETPSASGSVLDMLQRFGINTTQAAMAVASMFFTVGGSNPSAPTTMVIVKGAQKALNELGLATGDITARQNNALQVDGILGTATMNALKRFVGNDVASRTWIYVYGVLRNKIDTTGFAKPGSKPTTASLPGDGLPVDDGGSGLGVSKTVLMVGGGLLVAAVLFGGGKKSRRRKGRR